jgi:hypothetical protein
MDILFHRGILGGQAEGIPAHRVQNVEPLTAFVARHDIAERVTTQVAHMDPP